MRAERISISTRDEGLTRFHNISLVLGARCVVMDSMDVDKAIEYAARAADGEEHDDSQYFSYGDNLITCLKLRFDRVGLIEDLEAAVEAALMSVGTTPKDQAAMIGRQPDLSRVLQRLREYYVHFRHLC